MSGLSGRVLFAGFLALLASWGVVALLHRRLLAHVSMRAEDPSHEDPVASLKWYVGFAVPLGSFLLFGISYMRGGGTLTASVVEATVVGPYEVDEFGGVLVEYAYRGKTFRAMKSLLGHPIKAGERIRVWVDPTMPDVIELFPAEVKKDPRKSSWVEVPAEILGPFKPSSYGRTLVRFEEDGSPRFRVTQFGASLPKGSLVRVLVPAVPARPFELDDNWKVSGLELFLATVVLSFIAAGVMGFPLYTLWCALGAHQSPRSEVLILPLHGVASAAACFTVVAAFQVPWGHVWGWAVAGFLLGVPVAVLARLLFAMRPRRPSVAGVPAAEASGGPTPSSGLRLWAELLLGDRPATPAVILASNAWIAVGVLFLGWDAYLVVLLYWFENAILGFFMLLKVGWAKSSLGESLAKFYIVPFTAVHYSLFMMGHASLLIWIFGKKPMNPPPGPPGGLFSGFASTLDQVFGALDLWMIASIAIFLAAETYSFIAGYLGRREYLRATMGSLVGRAYLRILVVHVFLIMGGVLAQIAHRLLIVLFVLFKAPLEIYLARRGSRAAGSG